MNPNELVGWYQNKISKYDKNKWELSVEHKTINGFGKYLRSTKQKTELIDVDLVRGSSFAKAKAKHTPLTVIRLAFLRLALLPFYSTWWIEQTSRNIYKFLFMLYIFQLFNSGLYIYVATYCEAHTLSLRDIMIPNLLSLLLSVIHSQIVATAGTNRGGKAQFGLKEKKRKPSQGRPVKKSRRLSSHNKANIENLSKLAADKLAAGQEQPTFNIHLNSTTNCPNGLRNRNAKWNDIYSPYWLNQNELAPNVESKSEPKLETHLRTNLDSETKENCDETIGGSERSNIDHGFESFNGKSSSSDDLAVPTVSIDRALSQTDNENVQSDEYLNLKQNFLSTVNLDEIRENVFLSPIANGRLNTVFTSPWLGVTSNSDCSYSSGSDSDSVSDSDESDNKRFPLTNTLKPASVSDKISCTLWRGNRTTKVEMSMLDISSVIVHKVETMTSSCDYIYIGLLLSVLLAWVPTLCRISEAVLQSTNNEYSIQDIPSILFENASGATIIKVAFGETVSQNLFLSIGVLLRVCLNSLLFLMLAVAERTFKERLLYAKLFSHLTSSRRSKKSEVPHFRLSKLGNIKTWLSVRSYLKRRGPQRSVDVILSATLVLCLVFVTFLCAESLKDSIQQHWQCDLEVFLWSCSLGCFILRFMTLGTAINAKYRSVSILITEQINLYLKMEQNPEKKQSLVAANNVLKLAADLLKEIELPFKISGFNINPYLSAGIRVLIVSALSGICSEILGFKLKLFKLKE